MIVCPKCSTEFSHDAEGIGPEGITVRCSVCSHIFHVEIDRSVPAPTPRIWQLRGGGTTTTAPDIPSILLAIEASSLTPDHELSRSGDRWIRLGDIPEFSTIFSGYEGLPRVLTVREDAGSSEVSSTFSSAVAQALATGGSSAVGRTSEFVPAPPPDHGVDVTPPGMRRPASMLEAVTNAVASGMQERDDDAPAAFQRHRSEPILVSDIEREQAVAKVIRDESSSSSVQLYASADRSSASQDASMTSTDQAPASEVVIVKVDNQGSQGSFFWYALSGLALGCVVILAVPELREAVWSYNNPQQNNVPVGVVQPNVNRLPELAKARQAIYNIGLAESDRAQKELQQVIDSPDVDEQQADRARLTKAELLATRALAFTLALSVESTAHGGLARTRAKEDADWARLLLSAIDPSGVPDRVQLQRVEATLDLVDGKDQTQILNKLPVQGAEIVRLLVEAAPLWRDPQVSVPPGLISRLRSVSRPPTSVESVLAMALVRSRDNTRALAVVEQILARVPDQPTATTLKPWIEAKIAAEETSDSSDETGGEELLVDDSSGDETSEDSGGGRRPRPSGDQLKEKTTKACAEVQGGDIVKGLDALLSIASVSKSYDAYVCLGEGFAKQSRYDGSYTWYAKAVSLKPSSVKALEGAAKAANKINKIDDAVRHYTRLREVNPNHPDAIAFLAKHKPDELKNKDLLPSNKGEQGATGADTG